MNAVDIDRALRKEPALETSPDFAVRVMRDVRREAEARQGIPFPWRRLLPGLAVCAALTVAGVAVTGLGGEAPSPFDADAVAAALERSGLIPALTWVPTALAAGFGLAWGSLRLPGLRR